MGIQFSGDWNGYEQRWKRRLTLLESVMSEGADIIGEEMADIIRQVILTMPNRSKEDGRVKDGDMLKSVTTQKFIGGGKVLAQAGWPENSAMPDYVKFQEYGTLWIEGMFATDAAQRYGEQHAHEILVEAVRRMWRP